MGSYTTGRTRVSRPLRQPAVYSPFFLIGHACRRRAANSSTGSQRASIRSLSRISSRSLINCFANLPDLIAVERPHGGRSQQRHLQGWPIDGHGRHSVWWPQAHQRWRSNGRHRRDERRIARSLGSRSVLGRWRLAPLRPGPAPMASASGNRGLIATAQLAPVSVPGLFFVHCRNGRSRIRCSLSAIKPCSTKSRCRHEIVRLVAQNDAQQRGMNL